MPLINEFQLGGDGLYTTKQYVKLYDSAFVNPVIVFEQIKNGKGIFSDLGSLIISGVNFATANIDLIQAGIQSTGSVIQAGKILTMLLTQQEKLTQELML